MSEAKRDECIAAGVVLVILAVAVLCAWLDGIQQGQHPSGSRLPPHVMYRSISGHR